MFDIGFTEIMVILVVALVVIGPERLPTVARTIGALLGRLNRYVSDVKADVEREMRLDEMKKLQAEVEQQASSIERTVVQEMQSAQDALTTPVESVQQTLTEAAQEAGAALDPNAPALAPALTASGDATPAETASANGASAVPDGKAAA